jgi:hypothetical protein
MIDFSFTLKTEGDVHYFKFEGAIDEDAKFPVIGSAVKKVVVDLSGIRTINSVGIREWLHWIRPAAEGRDIILEQCPKSIVFQFNMVEGFLPPNVRVTTFFVPYFCEACEREENILFTAGKEAKFENGQVQLRYEAPKSPACTLPNCKIEMDVTESKYFQFLKRG